MATIDTALTTTSRVKNRLGIDHTDQDGLIDNFINAVTRFIEARTNRQEHGFIEVSPTDEVYNGSGIDGNRAPFLLLKQAPVDSISSYQYDAGTNDNPNWTDFTNNEYDLIKPEIGLIKNDANLPAGERNIRVSYTAGYKIDFANDTDDTKHTLPHEVSDLAERLVVKFYKRREDDGRSQVTMGTSTVEFRQYLDPIDKEVLSNYTRYYVRA